MLQVRGGKRSRSDFESRLAVLLLFGLFDVANSVTQGFDMYRILTIYSDPFTHDNTIFLFRFNTGFRKKTKHVFCYLSRASIT